MASIVLSECSALCPLEGATQPDRSAAVGCHRASDELLLEMLVRGGGDSGCRAGANLQQGFLLTSVLGVVSAVPTGIPSRYYLPTAPAHGLQALLLPTPRSARCLRPLLLPTPPRERPVSATTTCPGWGVLPGSTRFSRPGTLPLRPTLRGRGSGTGLRLWERRERARTGGAAGTTDYRTLGQALPGATTTYRLPPADAAGRYYYLPLRWRGGYRLLLPTLRRGGVESPDLQLRVSRVSCRPRPACGRLCSCWSPLSHPARAPVTNSQS